MEGLTTALLQDRARLSEKLAEPLAALLSEHGAHSTAEELRALIMDERTPINFPKLIIRRKGDVEVEVTDATTAGKAVRLKKLTTQKPP